MMIWVGIAFLKIWFLYSLILNGELNLPSSLGNKDQRWGMKNFDTLKEVLKINNWDTIIHVVLEVGSEINFLERKVTILTLPLMTWQAKILLKWSLLIYTLNKRNLEQSSWIICRSCMVRYQHNTFSHIYNSSVWLFSL